MDLPVIQIKKREKVGSRASRKLREDGLVPINLFGLGRPSVSFCAPMDAVESAVKNGAHLVELDFEGTNQQGLIRDVQWDALGDDVLHVDFSRVDRDKKVIVTVALEFEGHAVGTTKGGIVNHVLNDVAIECLPGKIPEHLVVNVAPLDIGDHLFVKDLDMPEGVEPAGTEDMVVATVTAVVAAEEETDEQDEPEIVGQKPEGGDEDSKEDES